ncbi:MAG: hypothetical protein EBZ48_14450 [Proteobacteria bacterium]|nr:hypothetical protein [Pseudomonadota bacterium]
MRLDLCRCGLEDGAKKAFKFLEQRLVYYTLWHLMLSAELAAALYPGGKGAWCNGVGARSVEPKATGAVDLKRVSFS